MKKCLFTSYFLNSDFIGGLVAEEEEEGIWEEGGDVGTRGTILTVSHFHIFSYKLSKGKLSQFNPILEQFGRPRSRVTQECGELCQLRWSNQYFQLIFIHSFIHTSLRSILPRKMHGKPSVSTEKPCTGLCLLRKQGKAPPDPALDKVLFHFSIFPEIQGKVPPDPALDKMPFHFLA